MELKEKQKKDEEKENKREAEDCWIISSDTKLKLLIHNKYLEIDFLNCQSTNWVS